MFPLFLRLAQSVKKRGNIAGWSVLFAYEGELASGTPSPLFPYLVVVVRHRGSAFDSQADIQVAFKTGKVGHGLSAAKNALRGYVAWYVLSGKNGELLAFDS